MKLNTVISVLESTHEILRIFWNIIILVMFGVVVTLIMIQVRDSPEIMSKVSFSVKILNWVMVSYIVLDMLIPVIKGFVSSNKEARK